MLEQIRETTETQQSKEKKTQAQLATVNLCSLFQRHSELQNPQTGRAKPVVRIGHEPFDWRTSICPKNELVPSPRHPQARTYLGCWPKAQCGPDLVDGDDGQTRHPVPLHRFTDMRLTSFDLEFFG